MERNGYGSGHRKHHHKREESSTEQQNLSSAIFGNLNINNLANLINSVDVNELVASINNNNIASDNGEKDEAVLRKEEIATALRTLINCDKSELVQVLLKFYALRKPLKK
ncbi:hypothetical protein [Clostridium oryzae]|uniref:Uncharacterized protein n=1 Tax=Clostridium oryzae TaxID=1450648 RepID=A0A1V4I5U4_9CLOT|nr:hypothetical protein [Clostridium oryzae]OPJ55346.1 hypothetical protein CLORY_44380 [Clostridium oryzae]